jgi:hypothetical protein
MTGLKPCAIGLLLSATLLETGWVQANAACTLRLGPSAVDFGATTRGQLLERPVEGDELSFGRRRVQVHVQCEQVGPLRLAFVAPVVDAGHYRFGAGTLRVHVVAVRVDGKTVQWFSDGQGGSPDAQVLRPGESLVPAYAGTALEGQRMEVEVELEARVKSAATRVSDSTRFETGARFELR